MPMYVYRCAECEYEHERNVPVDDRDLQECGDCENMMIRQIRFTGSVWAPSSTGGYAR